MSLGTKIKQRREELGMTQTQLADKLGVTKGAVGNYETDANAPKMAVLNKLFQVLQCDANYLFQDDLPDQPYTPSPEELAALRRYRNLDKYGKAAVAAILDAGDEE